MSDRQYDLFVDRCIDDAIRQVDLLIEQNEYLITRYDDMIDRITKRLVEGGYETYKET